ncbi:MAG: tetratricopeptide repeat protein [bacterium]
MSALLLALLVATGAPSFFEQGNAAYEAGDYELAIAGYDSAARAPSAAVFYNRGNARFKLGQLGRALADYRRARVLAPADPDVRHNLEFVRAYRPDRTLEIVNPLARLATAALRATGLPLARLATGFLAFAALAGLGLFALSRARGWLWAGVGLAVLAGWSAASWLSWSAEVGPDQAVVTRPEQALRSGPGEEYKDILIVHDGLEVSVRERRGRWVLVQAPGGEGGWADSGAVETIFPR